MSYGINVKYVNVFKKVDDDSHYLIKMQDENYKFYEVNIETYKLSEHLEKVKTGDTAFLTYYGQDIDIKRIGQDDEYGVYYELVTEHYEYYAIDECIFDELLAKVKQSDEAIRRSYSEQK